MADMASCNSAESQYDAQVRPMVQRMEDMSGSMHSMMDSQGAGSHGDMSCMSGAMRAELAQHKAMACASADMAANQAEAMRHADSMEGYAAHQRARAEEMMSMMGGGMMGGGSGTSDAGMMGGFYRAVDGGYMMDGGFSWDVRPLTVGRTICAGRVPLQFEPLAQVGEDRDRNSHSVAIAAGSATRARRPGSSSSAQPRRMSPGVRGTARANRACRTDEFVPSQQGNRMTSKKLLTLATAHALLTASPAFAVEHDQHDHAAMEEHHQHVDGSAKPSAKARTIEIAVTSEGFVPAEVKVRKGEKVNLVVTRKTDRTCATALVMKDKGINVDLPLNQPVTVALQADKKGELKYACPMDMITGKVLVD